MNGSRPTVASERAVSRGCLKLLQDRLVKELRLDGNRQHRGGGRITFGDALCSEWSSDYPSQLTRGPEPLCGPRRTLKNFFRLLVRAPVVDGHWRAFRRCYGKTLLPLGNKAHLQKSDSLPRCCRFPPTAAPSPAHPEELQNRLLDTPFRLRGLWARSIQSPVRSSSPRTSRFASGSPRSCSESGCGPACRKRWLFFIGV